MKDHSLLVNCLQMNPILGLNCVWHQVQLEFWPAGEYAGVKIKIQNLYLSIPKICSMMLWADEWWRLKCSLLAGLCIYKYQMNFLKSHIPQIGTTPLCKMVAHTLIWKQELITSSKICICKAIFTLGYHKISLIASSHSQASVAEPSYPVRV